MKEIQRVTLDHESHQETMEEEDQNIQKGRKEPGVVGHGQGSSAEN